MGRADAERRHPGPDDGTRYGGAGDGDGDVASYDGSARDAEYVDADAVRRDRSGPSASRAYAHHDGEPRRRQ